MAKYITWQQACDVLMCGRSTFFRRYRSQLEPAKKIAGTKSWLFTANAVQAVKNIEAYKTKSRAAK